MIGGLLLFLCVLNQLSSLFSFLTGYIILYLFFSLAFLIISFVFLYIGFNKSYRRVYRKRLRKYLSTQMQILKSYELSLEYYKSEINILREKETKTSAITKEQIGHLNQKIQILVNENREIRDTFCSGGIFVLKQLKKQELIVSNMTNEEKQKVFECIDLLFGNFVTRLKVDYKLNENNLILAILIKLSFSTLELMFVFECEKNSIFKKKQRLKERLCLETKDDLVLFLDSYSSFLST